jgi:hypothetical protein
MFSDASLANGLRLDGTAEEFLATLTDAAYRVALKHNRGGNFLDLELELWAALRRVVASQVHVRHRPLRAVAVS